MHSVLKKKYKWNKPKTPVFHLRYYSKILYQNDLAALYCRCDRWYAHRRRHLIAFLSNERAGNPLVTFYDIEGRKGDILLFRQRKVKNCDWARHFTRISHVIPNKCICVHTKSIRHLYTNNTKTVTNYTKSIQKSQSPLSKNLFNILISIYKYIICYMHNRCLGKNKNKVVLDK
jgi:hypothetical protein